MSKQLIIILIAYLIFVTKYKMRDIYPNIPITYHGLVTIVHASPITFQLGANWLLQPVQVSTPANRTAAQKDNVHTSSLLVFISSQCVLSDNGLKNVKNTSSKHNNEWCGFIVSVIEWWRTGIAFFTSLKQKLMDNFLELLPQPHAGMVIAAVLGDKTWLSDDMRPQFETTGTQHLLATSGLHLSLMITLLKPVIAFVKGRQQAIVLWLVAACFVLIVGLRISLLRAFGMLSLSLLARHGVYRQYNALYALSIIALTVLFFDLETVTSISFLLSFGATWSIIVYADLISQKMFLPEASCVYADLAINNVSGGSRSGYGGQLFFKTFLKELNQIWNYLRSLVIVGIAAQLVTVPLILIYFEEAPLLAFIPSAAMGLVMPILLGGEVMIGSLYFLVGRWVSNPTALFAIRLFAWLPAEIFARLLILLGNQHWIMVKPKLNYFMLLVWIFSLWLLYKLLNYQGKKRRRTLVLRSNLSCFASR